MKKQYILIIIALVVLVSVMGWLVLFKKSGTGGECKTEKDCYAGLKCISNKCSDGKEGSACDTYKDCQKDLLCKNSVCIGQPPIPAYSNYFDKIELQKMKGGIPPGPNNLPVASKEFKIGDGMNVDMQLKDNIEGEAYFDMVDSVSGERIFMHPKFDAKGSVGRGFPAPSKPGNYDLNVYFNDELVHTIAFKVVSQ